MKLANTYKKNSYKTICKASEDFVHANCNCGALSESRRDELREQLLIGA